MWLPVFSFWGLAWAWASRQKWKLSTQLPWGRAWTGYTATQVGFFLLLPALIGLPPLAFQGCVSIYFLLALLPFRKLDWKPKKGWWRWGLAAYLLGLLLAVLVYALFRPSPSANSAVDFLLKSQGWERFLWLVCLCFLTPIQEEAWYRSILGGTSRSRILGSALIFALVHIDPKALLQLFGLGLLFNWAHWGGGFPAAVLAHALWNSTVAVFLLGA